MNLIFSAAAETLTVLLVISSAILLCSFTTLSSVRGGREGGECEYKFRIDGRICLHPYHQVCM